MRPAKTTRRAPFTTHNYPQLGATLMKTILRIVRREEGVTAIEYGLLAALIALAIVVGAGAAGTSLNTMFTSIGTFLTTQAANIPGAGG